MKWLWTLSLLAFVPAADAQLVLKHGDHISYIGNTLADRMQHDGWLDTYIYARFPKHNLSIRNLGFAADELTLRLRSAGFGSPEDWLNRCETDVVFAFFGYNESFGGDAGLGKFKSDLDAFVKKTLKAKYSPRGNPRLVLFSPIAHEDHKDRNLPDGAANNKRIALYTVAMAEVAKANKVTFVDLFNPTLNLYSKAEKPLTVNGVHMTPEGDRQLAAVIDQALFGAGGKVDRAEKRMTLIREAVLDRNFHWFNRYRTVDGYSIYGGRADLRFVGGQTNRVVAQREMEILDIMTANRDKRIWGVLNGDLSKVDDSDLPPFIPVITNKPGPLPGGKHLFLSGEESIKKMTLAKGMKINLFASEKEFPELVAPVQMSWDAKGRLWVAVWPTYPHWTPGQPMNDKILIFEDTNGDGKADKMTVFADNLHCPTGFEFYKDGIIVAQAPDVVFLRDTDGDGKADKREILVSGIDSADTHHTANSFVLDPGGALYFQEGTFHHTQVETPWGPPARRVNAGVYRFEPRTFKFETYVAYGFANPHGHVFDRWGQDIVVDGTGAVPYHAPLFSGFLPFPIKHGRPPTVYNQRTRPCPGMEILSSRHFPPEFDGNLLVGNVIGFQGILRYRLTDAESSLGAEELEPMVSSTDPNFRPSDIKVGPDGAVYFSDWHNPIIGHMQHNLRDPSRDHEHGRIYRITYEGRPLLRDPKIAGEPIEKLLDLLKSPEDRVRYRTRIELGGRDSDKVVAAARKWITTLDEKDKDYEHQMLEALWIQQYHNVVDDSLLKRMLRSPDHRARAAATRVLCYQRDLVKNPLDLLRTQINDSHSSVRLQAIRALSFFRGEEALAIAVELLAHPDDEALRYVFNETLATLERRLGSGKLDRGNIAASILKMLDSGKLPAERAPILIETVTRHGGPKELQAIWAKALKKDAYAPKLRREVLDWLADAANQRRVQPKVELASLLNVLSDSDAALLPSAIRLTAAWKVKDAGPELRKLALNAMLKAEARDAAIDALATLADPDSKKTLVQLTEPSVPTAVRFRAAIALGQVDLNAGAIAAAKALAASKETDDPSGVVEAYLVRKKGPETLAAALEKETVSVDSAKRILRAMFMAGKNDPALGAVVSKFAGLDASPKLPTAAEIKTLSMEAMKHGDAGRGEAIFRRADVGCFKCHSINKAGGNIGPDLGPIGSSSPVEYVVQSILDPSASIKEEYLTKVISTASGHVVMGVVVERNKNIVALKDATGKITRIPIDDIDTEIAGKSLMPEGITRILTRNELLDLIRFVSELGKAPELKRDRIDTIQRWKRLRDVATALKEGVPNRDVLRDMVLGVGPEAWENVYAKVGGDYPLAEIKKGPGAVVYLQGEINVLQPGAVELDLAGPKETTLWVDENQSESAGKSVVNLTPGRHRITVRAVVAGSENLRLAVRKATGSKAHFEIVHAD